MVNKGWHNPFSYEYIDATESWLCDWRPEPLRRTAKPIHSTALCSAFAKLRQCDPCTGERVSASSTNNEACWRMVAALEGSSRCDSTIRRRLAANIRARRIASGLTQKGASDRVGIFLRHWQLIEAGRSNVTLETLVRVSRSLGVDPTELLREE